MCIVIQSTCVEAAAVAAATLRTQRTHSDFELYDCHYVTTRYSIAVLGFSLGFATTTSSVSSPGSDDEFLPVCEPGTGVVRAPPGPGILSFTLGPGCSYRGETSVPAEGRARCVYCVTLQRKFTVTPQKYAP